MSEDVKKLCEAKTLQEQDEIWRSLRRVFIEGWFVKWLVNNPIFLWNALGVSTLITVLKPMLPCLQAFTDEGTVHDFIRDTLDPIGSYALLSKGAYHYLLVGLRRAECQTFGLSRDRLVFDGVLYARILSGLPDASRI